MQCLKTLFLKKSADFNHETLRNFSTIIEFPVKIASRVKLGQLEQFEVT